MQDMKIYEYEDMYGQLYYDPTPNDSLVAEVVLPDDFEAITIDGGQVCIIHHAEWGDCPMYIVRENHQWMLTQAANIKIRYFYACKEK